MMVEQPNDFEKILKKNVTANTMRNLEKVLDALKNIGCDTARSVLELSKEELLRRTDLEEETIANIIGIFEAEFED